MHKPYRTAMTPERFAKLKRVLQQRQPDLTVLAEDVHKSHNIAAIRRSCDAVGVQTMHAVSPGGEVLRHHMSAAGTQAWVPVRMHDTVELACLELKQSGMTIAAAHFSSHAIDFRAWDYTAPCAILLGSELRGVSDAAAQLADAHLTIPMEGMVASLNVSVAAALILYEAQRQRRCAGLYDRCRLERDEYERLLFEWSHPDIARRCRSRGRPYPALDEDGNMLSNPLRD